MSQNNLDKHWSCFFLNSVQTYWSTHIYIKAIHRRLFFFLKILLIISELFICVTFIKPLVFPISLRRPHVDSCSRPSVSVLSRLILNFRWTSTEVRCVSWTLFARSWIPLVLLLHYKFQYALEHTISFLDTGTNSEYNYHPALVLPTCRRRNIFCSFRTSIVMAWRFHLR